VTCAMRMLAAVSVAGSMPVLKRIEIGAVVE
jgi:hypothetical protein